YHARGHLAVVGCTFATNRAPHAYGGAIFTYPADPATALGVTNSTFVGNVAQSRGGAVAVFGPSASFNSCTFSGNSCLQGSGGGLAVTGAEMRNCIIAGNSAAPAPDIYAPGPITSEGYNLVGLSDANTPVFS